MTRAKDGGPAFPVPMIPCDRYGGFTEVSETGLTLRDWFAGLAMQSLVANGTSPHSATFAGDAYRYADAMLQARDR